MSSASGKGVSKAELRRALAAGYSFSLEELTLDRIPGVEVGPGVYFARYDIAAINAERAEEIADWPEWHQKLERALDEHRLRQQARDPEEWERVLAALSDEEWTQLWEAHPTAAQIAREYRALEQQGKLATVFQVVSENYYGADVRGVFSTLAKAKTFADEGATRHNVDYVILETAIDAPTLSALRGTSVGPSEASK